MKKSLLLIALAAGFSSAAHAQTVVSWNFLGDAGNQASEAAASGVLNVTGSAITRSSGLAPAAATSSFNSQGWESTTSGFGGNEYLSFGFSVADGFTLDLAQLQLGTRSSGTGPGTMGLFYSGDLYANRLHTFSQNNTDTLLSTIDLSGLNPVAGIVDFRIYEIGNTQADGSGATASGGTFRLVNFNQSGMFFTGSVSAVPEPETYAMLLAGLALMGSMVKRRKV